MPTRPLSIYERATGATIPPPDFIERRHLVVDGENLTSIAALEYRLEEYDPDLWRLIASRNGITDPIIFNEEYRGKVIFIPPRPLPEFQ